MHFKNNVQRESEQNCFQNVFSKHFENKKNPVAISANSLVYVMYRVWTVVMKEQIALNLYSILVFFRCCFVQRTKIVSRRGLHGHFGPELTFFIMVWSFLQTYAWKFFSGKNTKWRTNVSCMEGSLSLVCCVMVDHWINSSAMYVVFMGKRLWASDNYEQIPNIMVRKS